MFGMFFAMFLLNLEVTLDAFLACFGRAAWRSLSKSPPAVHRNCEKRIKRIKQICIFTMCVVVRFCDVLLLMFADFGDCVRSFF